MNTESTPLEIVDENPLAVAVKQYGLELEGQQQCMARFQPLMAEARGLIEQAQKINITATSTTVEKKLVRTMRLGLRDVRCRCENTRKELKEDSLRRGKVIDAMNTIIKSMIEPVEQHLEDQEKFEERQEAVRKQALRAEREAKLAVYKIDTQFYSLGDMSEEAFVQLLDNTKLAHEAKLEQARKAEEERIRRENEELERQRKLRQDNERLRREAEENARIQKGKDEAARLEREKLEAIAKAEREKAEAEKRAAAEAAERERKIAEDNAAAQLAAERETARLAREEIERKAAEQARIDREAREKAEAELKAVQEAEEKRKVAAARAARKAANAGDAVKLVACADAIDKATPSLKDPDLQQRVMEKISTLIAWLKEEHDNL